MKLDLKNYTRAELQKLLLANGYKKFSATQIFEWLYSKRVEDFEDMTNISKALRVYLHENMSISRLHLQDRQIAKDETEKYLFRLEDGHCVETVMIPGDKRKTLCVSSQVGCKRKCTFCVSGKSGLVRDLTSAEIVNQVLQVNEHLSPNKISNIVFMGIGEPLDNYDNVMKAIDIIRDGKGIYIGKRKISISTAGVIPGIERMIEEKNDVCLSVSLHAATDQLRSKIMPINKVYPLAELKKSLMRFTKVMGFPIFFEFILVGGLNDSVQDAKDLAKFLHGISAKVNLIPYNPSPFFKWKAPSSQTIDSFKNVLESKKVFCTLRRSRGQDIAAACGQLKAQQESK